MDYVLGENVENIFNNSITIETKQSILHKIFIDNNH